MADQSDFMTQAMEQGLHGLRSGFNPGEKLHASITKITRNGVFVDVNAKSEGIVDRAELEVDGELKVQVGDKIDVYYKENSKGEMRFTARVRAGSADAMAVEQAFHSGIPVEGKVTADRNGGFEVTIGSIKAFCPFSQIGLRGQRNEDSPSLVGEHFQFLITEFEDERNVVVSRRRLLEIEQEQVLAYFKARLKEGDTLSGKITRLADFGAFVELGAGLDGLIPMSELGHGRVKKAGDVVQPGDTVSVRVIKLDWERGRITLSLRSLQADPWLSVAAPSRLALTMVGP